MQEHQAELEKEQFKQATVGEVLSKTTLIKEPTTKTNEQMLHKA